MKKNEILKVVHFGLMARKTKGKVRQGHCCYSVRVRVLVIEVMYF